MCIQNRNDIKSWTEDELKKWAACLKTVSLHRLNLNLHEWISVVIVTVSVAFNYKPRDVQIISVILFLIKKETKRRLAQVRTGVGKSIIIAMISASKVLKGNFVDVMTSSETLALRDKLDNEKFIIFKHDSWL